MADPFVSVFSRLLCPEGGREIQVGEGGGEVGGHESSNGQHRKLRIDLRMQVIREQKREKFNIPLCTLQFFFSFFFP